VTTGQRPLRVREPPNRAPQPVFSPKYLVLSRLRRYEIRGTQIAV